jgi:hypothetical protein
MDIMNDSFKFIEIPSLCLAMGLEIVKFEFEIFKEITNHQN